VTLALLLNKKSPDRIQERRTTPRRTRKKKKKEEQEKKKKKEEQERRRRKKNKKEEADRRTRKKKQALRKRIYSAERKTLSYGLKGKKAQERKTGSQEKSTRKKTRSQERSTRKKNKKPRKKHKKEAQNNIQHELKPKPRKTTRTGFKEEKYTAEREIPIAGLPSPSIQLSSEVNRFACPPLHILIPRPKFGAKFNRRPHFTLPAKDRVSKQPHI